MPIFMLLYTYTSILKEISSNYPSPSSSDLSENDDGEALIGFPAQLPRLRRTGHCYCKYCTHIWGDFVDANLSRNRVCVWCSNMIKDRAWKIRQRFEKFWSKYLDNRRNCLEQIIEIGLHPDRVSQTQLGDFVHLFHFSEK